MSSVCPDLRREGRVVKGGQLGSMQQQGQNRKGCENVCNFISLDDDDEKEEDEEQIATKKVRGLKPQMRQKKGKAAIAAAVVLVGNAKPSRKIIRSPDQLWVHLAMDPASTTADEGIDFNLTVSYYPGADIRLAKATFTPRKAPAAAATAKDATAMKTDNLSDESLHSASPPRSLRPPNSVRQVATIMDDCHRSELLLMGGRRS